jgi:hypothetical protein
MTPKGKAKELFKKYSKGKDEYGWSLCEFDSCAKQCAIIAVDEIINAIEYLDDDSEYFWEQVKQELEKL